MLLGYANDYASGVERSKVKHYKNRLALEFDNQETRTSKQKNLGYTNGLTVQATRG